MPRLYLISSHLEGEERFPPLFNPHLYPTKIIAHLYPASRLKNLPQGRVVLNSPLQITMGLPFAHKKRYGQPEHVPLQSSRSGM